MKNRKPNRLKGFNYSGCGCYFITICTQNRIHHFGEIINGIMKLSETGNIAANNWESIPRHFPNILLDEYVIMPNHIHGIICITEEFRNNLQLERTDSIPEKKIHRNKMILSRIIQQFKASVTRDVNKLILNGFKWQRSFYDHIIRNERSFENIQSYIFYNPVKWEMDIENNKNQFNDTLKYYDNIFTGKI